MKQLISFVISIVVVILYLIFINEYIFPTYETNEQKGDSMFGIVFIGFVVYCFSYIIFKWLLNQLSRFKIFHWLGCYLPNPKKHHNHSCKYCDKKYISSWGKKFGGFGERWEEDNYKYGWNDKK